MKVDKTLSKDTFFASSASAVATSVLSFSIGTLKVDENVLT